MQRFFMLLICLGLAFLMLRYTEKLKRLLGDIAFAEKYLGAGGTYTLIKLIALGLIVFGFVYASGQIDVWICKYGSFLVGTCGTTE